MPNFFNNPCFRNLEEEDSLRLLFYAPKTQRAAVKLLEEFYDPDPDDDEPTTTEEIAKGALSFFKSLRRGELFTVGYHGSFEGGRTLYQWVYDPSTEQGLMLSENDSFKVVNHVAFTGFSSAILTDALGRLFEVEDTNETNFEDPVSVRLPLAGISKAELAQAFAMAFFQDSTDKLADAEKLVAELSRIAETPS